MLKDLMFTKEEGKYGMKASTFFMGTPEQFMKFWQKLEEIASKLQWKLDEKIEALKL